MEQNGQNHTTYIVQQEKKSNGLGTAGFVMALLGFLTGWIPFVGFFFGSLFWLLGLIFSLIAVFRQPRGFAIAGLVITFVESFILIFFVGASLFFLA